MELRKEKVKKKQKQKRITEVNKKKTDRKYAGKQKIKKLPLP